jgi:acetoin utilization deacetylase AcuC-like enzyme
VVIGSRFYDELILGHNSKVDLLFLPSRMEKRVRNILKGLDLKLSYPEHPGRLSAMKELLDAEPIPGVQFKSGPHVSYEQLGRLHTTSYHDHIFSLEGKTAWLDIGTTAVSPSSIKALTTAAGSAIDAVECVVRG